MYLLRQYKLERFKLDVKKFLFPQRYKNVKSDVRDKQEITWKSNQSWSKEKNINKFFFQLLLPYKHSSSQCNVILMSQKRIWIFILYSLIS